MIVLYSDWNVQVLIDSGSRGALVAEPEQIIRQHQPLIDALLQGDRLAASAALSRHIEEEGTVLVKHLRAVESESTG